MQPFRFHKVSLSLRLLLYIIACSAFFTLLASLVQLYTTYLSEVSDIDNTLSIIENSYVPSIAASTYQLDEAQTKIQLVGAAALKDITYLEVRETANFVTSFHITEGDANVSQDIIRHFPLNYQSPSGRLVEIGTLVVVASLEGVYLRTWESAITILIVNALKMLPASICIFLIIRFVVTRHLAHMSRYTRRLNLNQLDQELRLHRKPHYTDELEQVVQAINTARINLRNDIKDIQVLRQSLGDERNRLYTTLASIGDGIITTNRKMEIRFLNPAAERILGWSFVEIQDKPLQEIFAIIDSQTRQEIENPVEHVLKTESVITLTDLLLITREKREIPIDSNGAPIRDKNGNLHGVVLIFRDISQRKTAEAELHQLRNYLSNIINSMPSILVGVDKDSKITRWNTMAEQSTGISAAEAKGKSFTEVFPHFAQEAQKITESIQTRQVKQERKRRHPWKHDPCYEDLTIYPLIANGVEGAVIRIDDVTDKVRFEEIMVHSEKMASVGGLAAGMAHELNNPLGSILQGIQNIRRRMSNTLPSNLETAAELGLDLNRFQSYLEKREVFTFIEGVQKSGERAASLIKEMLNFSRKSYVSFEPCNLADLIERTLKMAESDYDLKRDFDFRKIQILREFDPSTPIIMCKSNEIQQVLLNILKNGAQAMAPDAQKNSSSRFILRLYPDPKTKTVCLEIEDNGPGMEEEIRKRIFEPFYTTKKPGRGTGLGLSVSFFIITNNHSGTIQVNSAPGKGCAFFIRLPISQSNPEDEPNHFQAKPNNIS